MTRKLTHIDKTGKARMVDVGRKPPTRRMAVASGLVRMKEATLAAIASNEIAKGDVLAVAKIAGIQAAKRTAELIPLCHPLALTSVEVDFEMRPRLPGVGIRATAHCVGPTGVEIEALTAVTVAALTIYDMCKAIDRAMTIEEVRLELKKGGRSGTFRRRVG
ncbi:MAG: cyclic pyranopterin monophosphate synthase MoaC [bacterium]